MRKTIYIVLMLLILLTSILVQSAFAYYNAEFDFSITPPSGWIIEEQEGKLAVLFTDPSSITGALIDVGIEQVTGTISQYIDASKLSLKTTFSNYVLVSEDIGTIGGRDCYQIVSTYTTNGEEMKMSQFIFIEKEKSYVVTCRSLLPHYVDSSSNFENCVSSFRIGDSTSNTPDTTDTTDITAADYALIIGLIVAGVIIAVVILLVIMFIKRKGTESPIMTDQMTDE
ncbi:hypothetical protein AC478_01800 [miscellaneous Crenarchaeota group-1 archaeon SG8-32-3]|uniref:PsbP C-terminal domain-containing protein n=1 Tax=miscellaneous Crenarchaeota group-1 archaeon SG8-32-3 TaxID=1685125 RepID=A0A0M0BU77_9ARCH|nr:MAG: hypothetical protein AC478_01800 [miscellaneous Crenarchaeota group-1 archaeon SG8-32-3]